MVVREAQPGAGRPSGTRPTPRARLRRAFTMVELMTVIIIIGILVSILFPTIKAVLQQGQMSKTRAMIAALDAGCQQYKTDTKLYPGQRYKNLLTGDGGSYTGSQVLAVSLYGYGYTDITLTPEPTSAYTHYKPDCLETLETKPHTLSDLHVKPMAICYYVSRVGETGLGQFKEGDNSAYTDGHQGKSDTAPVITLTLSDAIDDDRFTNTPYKAGGFILIAPGSTERENRDDATNKTEGRFYFSRNDLTNWK